MTKLYKGKAKNISAFLGFALLFYVSIAGAFSSTQRGIFGNSLTAASDTVPAKKAGRSPIPARKKIAQLPKSDSALRKQQDTTRRTLSDTTPVTKPDTLIRKPVVSESAQIDSFDIKISRDSLSGPVFYHADDSMVMDVPTRKIMLYGKKSNTRYLDNELSAPGIQFDQKQNLVTAWHVKDSNGLVIASPTFKQDDLLTISDTITFNMKTGKGLTKGTYTQQGEMYIYGERIKKIDSSAFYAFKARFTTCNLDTPHFAFVSKKIKFINNKFAVTGPVHPEFEGVPVPVVLPFGIYPMYQGRHSGLIAPAFTANQQFGLALEGIGYYKVINDNWDVTARGTIYSYGGWTLNISPRYYKRYHYQGNFSIDLQHTKYNFKGDPDFSSANTFKIRWSHSSDNKARPGVTFSANVQASSSKFNQYIPNNPVRNFDNQLYSTINFTKIWKDKPFNLSLIANHQQNTISRIINITLPDVSFNLNTIYPFRRKEMAGTPKWYENIGFALNTNAKSQTYFSDDTAVAKNVSIMRQISGNHQWGASHSVPITLSLPPLGPLQISPSVTYSERWYQQKFIQRWNNTDNKLDTSIRKGFYAAREMSFGVSLSTRIFGMFGFRKGSKVQAIRHEIRPQISASYSPNMNGKYWYTTQINSTGGTARYSVFANNIVSPYSEGQFGGLSFSIDNNIQMKVRNKKDTSAGAVKKITLIDGLSIASSYNFLLDSFQLTAFNLGARTNLFDKINITASAVVDPYQYDLSTGRRTPRLVWKDRFFSLGRLMNVNVSAGFGFKGGDKNNQNNTQNRLQNAIPIDPRTGLQMDESTAEAAYIRSNPGEFADFSIPWSINFGLTMRYGSSYSSTLKNFEGSFNADANINGTLNLTPKWQIGMNGIYSFTTHKLGMFTMSISREMHCWQMSINVSPTGPSRFFNITISPKSALLRDVRINRTRYFFDL